MERESDSLCTWVGDIGCDRAEPSIVHVGDQHLYAKFGFLTESGRDEAVRNLENNQSPAAALGWGTTKILLADIRELRFSQALNILEIYYGEKRRCYDVHSHKDPVHQWLYQHLRERLAPEAEPEPGFLSRWGALFAPVGWLLFALILAGLLLIVAATANPNPHNTGRGAGIKDLIDRVLYRLGVFGTGFFASIPIVGLIAWVVYRWRNPPEAEIITIPPSTNLAAPGASEGSAR